jgi:hypothetical protein
MFYPADPMSKKLLSIILTLSCTAGLMAAPKAATRAQKFPLKSRDKLELLGTKVQLVTYRGRKAVKLTESAKAQGGQALLTDSYFRDGVIEVDVAGLPAEGSDAGARGFVGISFRTSDDGSKYECFWIRPTNGRADNQLRRNHSTQYASYPEYPWNRLRQESPGVYESYADLEAASGPS